jgi:hypothetical protein
MGYEERAMTNNNILPGFDEQAEPAVPMELQILWSFSGCFLQVSLVTPIDAPSVSRIAQQIQKLIDGGYLRVIVSIERVPNELPDAVWFYFVELRRTLINLRGELVLVASEHAQVDHLVRLGISEKLNVQPTTEAAAGFLATHHTGNIVEEGLLQAIWYYRGFENDPGYMPANLEACQRIFQVLIKRNYSSQDYEAVKNAVEGLLTTKFHPGIQMWWVVKTMDWWLSENWPVFQSGSLLTKFKGIF